MNIDIIDLGINNLSSILRAFQLGAGNENVQIAETPDNLRAKSLLVLPGLGSFSSGVSALKRSGFHAEIIDKVRGGRPIVGICLGMQLLGNQSEESDNELGLGLIEGDTKLLHSQPGEKIPHIGWNEVSICGEQNFFGSLSSQSDFYFVHSYHFAPKNHSMIHSTTPFGNDTFASSVLNGHVLGFQFHPEKSGRLGLNLIKEVIAWATNET